VIDRTVYEFESETLERSTFAGQVADVCRDLKPRGDLLKSESPKQWMTPDIRMRLATISSWLAEAKCNNDGRLREAHHQLGYEQVSPLSSFLEGHRY